MIRPVEEDSDEDGNANLSSSDCSCSDALSQPPDSGSSPRCNHDRLKSNSNVNKMGDMLDGFGNGKGLYQNGLVSLATNGVREESGDGFLSDAGVESIVMSGSEA